MAHATGSGHNHEFVSEDKEWIINLTRTFIAISTTNYSRWEEFQKKFEEVFLALNKVYEPPFFTRVGLRYIDIFERTKVGLKDCHWGELLQPYVLGLLASEIESKIENYVSTCEIDLDDNQSVVRISSSFGQNLGTKEQVFIIDSDFYNEKKSTIESVYQKLNFSNSRATRLIQWMITKKLFDAMGPVKI